MKKKILILSLICLTCAVGAIWLVQKSTSVPSNTDSSSQFVRGKSSSRTKKEEKDSSSLKSESDPAISTPLSSPLPSNTKEPTKQSIAQTPAPTPEIVPQTTPAPVAVQTPPPAVPSTPQPTPQPIPQPTPKPAGLDESQVQSIVAASSRYAQGLGWTIQSSQGSLSNAYVQTFTNGRDYNTVLSLVQQTIDMCTEAVLAEAKRLWGEEVALSDLGATMAIVYTPNSTGGFDITCWH